MSHRLLLSFLVGAVFFAVLPIYAPPVLLQTTDTPPFLLGLGAGCSRARFWPWSTDRRGGCCSFWLARWSAPVYSCLGISYPGSGWIWGGALGPGGRRLLRGSRHTFLPVLGPPCGRRRGAGDAVPLVGGQVSPGL